MLLRVILAVDDSAPRRKLRQILADSDVVLESVRGRKLLWERAVRSSGDVLIATESVIPQPLEDSVSFMQGLPEPRSLVVICDREDAEHHAHLLAAGCDLVLYRGLVEESIADVLESLLEKRRQSAVRARPGRTPLAEPRLSDFVSESPSMQAFLQTVRRLVQSDTSLLMLGETGVGKERLAQAIHAEGRHRTAQPL